MEVFLIYGTNSGGTLDAGRQTAKVFENAGHTVHLRRADGVQPEELRQPDFIILGSCTWERLTEDGKRLEGELQQHMRELAEKIRGHSFHKQRFAVYGLGDDSYQDTCAAARHLEELVQDIDGQQVGKTLRLVGYYFALEQNQARVRSWAEHLLTKLPTA